MKILRLGTLFSLRSLYDNRRRQPTKIFEDIQAVIDLMRSHVIRDRIQYRIPKSCIQMYSSMIKPTVDKWLTNKFADGYDIRQLARAAVFVCVFGQNALQETMEEDLLDTMRMEFAKIDSVVSICSMIKAYNAYLTNIDISEVLSVNPRASSTASASMSE